MNLFTTRKKVSRMRFLVLKEKEYEKKMEETRAIIDAIPFGSEGILRDSKNCLYDYVTLLKNLLLETRSEISKLEFR